MPRPITWYPDELAWIEAHKDWPRALRHQGFVARFDRADVSEGALNALCKRKGWLTGRNGCFPRGATPMNKGKKMLYNPNTARTQFKAGGLPHNAKGAGHEYVDTDGYVVLIVAEPNPWRPSSATRSVHKHRWLWEQANGLVPQGLRLKCLDGDKSNTDPSNWRAIPIEMGPRLNGRFGRGYDAAPAELKPTIMAITELEHAVRVARKGSAA